MSEMFGGVWGPWGRTLSVWRLSLLFGPNRVEERQGSPSLSGSPTEEPHGGRGCDPEIWGDVRRFQGQASCPGVHSPASEQPR